MSITITPLGDTEFLAVTGDIKHMLANPAYPNDDDYTISLSDDTLLSGTFGDDQRHAIHFAIEGAAIVRQIKGGGVAIEWPVEWLTIASASASFIPVRQPACLPLFAQWLAA